LGVATPNRVFNRAGPLSLSSDPATLTMSPRPADPKPPSAEDDDVKSIKPSDIDAALKKAAPSLLMPYIEKYGPKVYPVISAAADVVDALAPYAEKAFDAGCRAYGWSKANHMEDLLPMLVICVRVCECECECVCVCKSAYVCMNMHTLHTYTHARHRSA
jgi:hypothetical protein